MKVGRVKMESAKRKAESRVVVSEGRGAPGRRIALGEGEGLALTAGWVKPGRVNRRSVNIIMNVRKIKQACILYCLTALRGRSLYGSYFGH
jgi:hypothetical protein